MENVTVLSISELIEHRLPLTGTLHQSSSCNSVQSISRPVPSAESNPSPKVLTSLKHPAIITGTLNLLADDPAPSNSKSSCPCSSSNSCFQFTDGSGTICCDILDLDVRMIGKDIRVLSWNFIPWGSAGGFLEIIKWDYLCPCPNADPVLLDSGNFSTSAHNLKPRHCVYGVLESVGPVSVVPCTVGPRDSKSAGVSDSSVDSKNLRGFMVLIMVCECRSCSSKDSMTLPEGEHATHSFVKPIVVYLCGSASFWHPVVTKFVGRFATFGNLKKKLVSIGKAESCLMYVSTDKSSIHLSASSRIWLPSKKTAIKGKGECGSYTGIIKGVYMQGMLVELENEVWLLLTDHLLSPPHSLRVGAIISVRNVHFVNPRFHWSKLLLLGACVKSSIFVQLFSPLETKCHVLSRSRCMLGKFIDTLPFSARLWVLILISSFRKMFAGVLSEKKILGSKHVLSEGRTGTNVCQITFTFIYLSISGKQINFCSMMNEQSTPFTTWVSFSILCFYWQHGAMMKLYEHDSCGCGSEPCSINLQTVIPISVLIFYCNLTGMRAMGLKNGVTMYELNQLDHFRLLSSSRITFHQPTRKVYRSEDIGFVLVGSLKISTYSGNLQLVDATGGVNVVVPDLPSTWNVDEIYEVTKYIMVIEGIPQMEKYLVNQPFSCRSFFQSISLERNLRIAIYVYFQYRDATCKNLPLYSCVDNGSAFEIFESGSYHLLQITHKFPMLQKFKGKQRVPNTSSMFVEAVLYPWNLFLTERDKKFSTNASMKHLREEDSVTSNYQNYADKRLKVDHPSRGPREECKCCNLSHHRISCVATIRSPRRSSQYMSGFLYNTRSKPSSGNGSKLSTQKILLEIEPESLLKYQFLQIGNYYIIKCSNDHSLFNIEECNCVNNQKFLITSSIHLWSISFTFDDDFLRSIESHDNQFKDSRFCDSEVISGDRIDLRHGSFSDIYLHLPGNAKNILVFDVEKQKENSTKLTSPCYRDVTSSDMQASVFCGSDCLFPEGNLSSLKGRVIAVHDLHQSCINSGLKCPSSTTDGSQCGLIVGAKSSCIHLLVEDKIVKVFGYLKNYALPVGFGLGVSATFHRVLELGDQQRLLTPISFIDINSIIVLDHSSTEKYSDSISSSDTISLQLFSELFHSVDCKLTKFRCRVVAVNFLVLEKNIDHVNLQVETSNRQPLVKIPLAGFMLDDGSSRCNCWTSSERAAALLRLHDPLSHSAFENIDWTLKWTGMTHSHSSHATASYHLGRVLKKHGRIVVRSCGSNSILNPYDGLDISLASNDALSIADESFLKFILVHSCVGAIWTLIGSRLDTDAVRSLLKGHTMEPGLMQSRDIWVADVYRTNALNEARNALLELMNS